MIIYEIKYVCVIIYETNEVYVTIWGKFENVSNLFLYIKDTKSNEDIVFYNLIIMW